MTINSETVLISTGEAATAPLVPSHMCVEGVPPCHTLHRTAPKTAAA